jgi:predicted MPP superfamily phosphohydrolase
VDVNLRRRQILVGFGAVAAAMAARAERRARAAWEFEIERVDVALRGLDPAHEGLRMAQLSDLHIGRWTPDGRIIGAVRTLQREAVDLVVLTGDYVTSSRDPLERVEQLLSGIGLPTFAVLGNHDHWTDAAYLRQGLERANITVLQNAHTVTWIRGAPLTLLGIDDEFSGHADVEATFQGAPQQGSRLVLAHTPVTVDALPRSEGLLCLSGHTHGGQVYVPRLSELLYTAARQPYVRGQYLVGGNQLYVNRGMGFGRGSPAVRVASEPELTIFTLHRAA